MSDNLSIDLGDYGKFSQQELKEQYGDNWLQAVEKLNGSFNTENGTYSYQEMYDTYGDKIPEALDALSGKKKAQEEPSEETPMEQPNMDSSSEAGSSESQESRADDVRALDLQVAGIDDPTSLDVSDYTTPENKPLSEEEASIQKAQAELESEKFNKKVDQTKVNLPNTVDYSANTLDEVTDNLPDEILDKVDSDVLAQAVAEKRAEAFDNLANQSLFDKYNEYKNKYLSKYDKNMSDALAKEDLATEMIGKELSLLGFDKEELAKYQDAVIELDKLRRNPVDPKSPEYREYVTKIRDLDAVVSQAREISDKQFMNPETGVIDENAKKESDDAVAKVVKEYKNDYNKLKTALDKEVAKQDYLESRIREIKGKEDLDVRTLIAASSNPFVADAEEVLTADVFLDSNKADQLTSLSREFKDSYNKSKVLSKALLLNEDVTATAKGFELLDGYDFDARSWVSAGEAFYEDLFEKDYLSDNDYASIIGDIANREGVDLTGEQIERLEEDFYQQFGKAAGTSLSIGAKIAVTNSLLKGASDFISLPEKLAKLKYVGKYLQEGSKLRKAVDYGGELIREDLAFQLTDEDLTLGMGSAEKSAEDIVEFYAKKLSAGKFGKLFKMMDSYATRVARKSTARTIGGTGSEYFGDFIGEGVKDGFFTEQQFKDVFGEGDEAIDKLYITAAMSGFLGLPSTLKSSLKSRYSNDTDNGKLLEILEEKEKIEKKLEKGELTEADLEVLTAEREKAESEESNIQEVTPEAEVIEESKIEPTTEEEAVTEPTVETEAEPVVVAEPTTEAEGDTFTEEELETPEVENTLKTEQKKVKNISKAISKIAPGVEFVFHKTSESYNNSSDMDVSDSRGYRDGNKIHIDLTSVKDNTSFHEAIHPVLDAVFEKSPETYNKLVSAMKSDPEFKSYFEAAKQDYKTENTQVNEALTEMMSDVANGKYTEGSSVYQKVKDFVKEILAKLGLRQSDFNIDLNKEVDVRQFAETIGKALAKGKEITFKQEDKLVESPTDVNFQKKGKRPDTIRKESQKEFKKEIDSVISKLSEAQRKTARGLLVGVKDTKTLAEAKVKLDNLVKYGAVNPSVKTKAKSKPDNNYQVISDKKLQESLAKAEKQAVKSNSKAQKQLVSDLKDKFKKLKGKSKTNVNAIIKKFLNVKTDNPAKVLEFSDYLDKVISDNDYVAKRAEAKNAKTKLKNALKAARKKYGNKLGVRGSVAEELSKMNLTRISDLDAFIESAETMIDSFKNLSSFESVKGKADQLIKEHRKAQEEFDARKQEIENQILEAEYNSSPLKDKMSLREFKKMKEQAALEEKTLKMLEDLEAVKEEMKSYLSSRIDYIKENFEELTDGLSNIEKAAIKDLINSKELMLKHDLLSASNLLAMHNAIDEVITYNSASGVAKVSSMLKSVQTSKKIQIVGEGKMDRGLFGRAKKFGSLSVYLKAITQDEATAMKVGSLLFGDYNRSFQKVKQKVRSFLERRSEMRDKLKIERPESARIGMISRLIQSEQGSTNEEIIEDIQTKIKSIEYQIEKLKKQGRKRYKREAEFLQEAYDSLGLKDFKTSENAEADIKALESKLSSNEKQFMDFLEQEFADIKSDVENSYLVNKGEVLNMVERYLPTASYKLGEAKTDLEVEFSRESLNATPSGRTFTRKKPSIKTMYNYDILGTTEQGYNDLMNDIHTLGDREVLTNTIKSKPVRDLFIGKDTGKEMYGMYDALTDRVRTLYSKRNQSHADNSLRASRVMKLAKDVYNSILSAPLRKTDQIIRQTIPIAFNTFVEAPLETLESFQYMFYLDNPSLSLDEIKKNRANLKSMLKHGNVDIRTLTGDPSMGNIEGLSEKAVRYIMKQTEAGKKIDKKILQKLGSGALTWADQLASGGSWLALYIKERKKQEGKGFKFDLEKESANPNKEAIDFANTKSDWINNKSDVTTDGGFFDFQNPSIASNFKNLFFLFKSFAMNASYRSAIDLRNLAKGVARGDGSVAFEATRALAGTLGSAMMFELLKDNFLAPLYDEIVESILGAEDPDPDKEVQDYESWSKGMFPAFAKSLMDLLSAWTPDGSDIILKKYINEKVLEAAKEKYKEEKEFNDLIGLETPKFDPYSEKIFYDEYNGPGMINRFSSVVEDIAEDIDIISGEQKYKKKLGHLETENEYDDWSKFLTTLHAASVITGNADAEILTKKYKRNKKKEKEKK